jgi:predicted PurR-regulated permease PerM
MDTPQTTRAEPPVRAIAVNIQALRWSGPLRWLVIILMIFMLREAVSILLPMTLALALMFVLTRPVEKLRSWGVPQAWGAALVLTLLLSIMALLCVSLAGPAAQWAERAPTTVRQLLELFDHLRDALLQPLHSRPRGAAAVAMDPLKDRLASEGLLLTKVVVGQLLDFTLSGAATIILTYFLLASQPWLLSRTLEAVRHPRKRALFLSGLCQAQRDIGLFLGTMGVINVGLGLVTGVALACVGLPNPVLWGTLVAFLNFIPYLGPALVMALLMLAGVMTFGPSVGMLAPALVFLVCHGIESNIVTPLVVGHRLRLSPLAVFLSVMAWGWLWGFGGALVAVPMLLAFRAWCRRSRALRPVRLYLEGDQRHVPKLGVLLASRERGGVRPVARARKLPMGLGG